MSKWLKILCILVVLAAVFLVLNRYHNIRTLQHLTCLPDAQKNPANPSRGFYVQIKSSDLQRLEKYADQVRLCLLTFDLYDYRNCKIAEEKLQELELFLQQAEKYHVKCIFRAAYGFDEKECNDADRWERLEEHVSQIAPILNRYAHQIYCVQAGFLGPWGEWHSSTWLRDDETAPVYRRKLLNLLLTQLDEQIIVDVRRPKFLREMDPLSPRLGFHNDGLLASETDLGTYDDPAYSRSGELAWCHQHVGVPQNGGEMPRITSYTDPANAIMEFQMLNISYLNLKYNEEVLGQWENQQVGSENALHYLSKKLGYRYYISELTYPSQIREGLLGMGQKMTVTLTNEGFAPIDGRYGLELIFEDGSGQHYVQTAIEALGTAEHAGSVALELPLKTISEYGIRRIGIRISERRDIQKPPCDCVELVNRSTAYYGGVNFFLDITGNQIKPLLD